MNHYPHHIGDFNNATRHLTRVERSLYRDVMDLYYDTEAPIPANDFDRLAKRMLAHTEEEKNALKSVLEEFFCLDGDVYRNDRCDREISKYQAFIESASRAGKASAAKRSKDAERSLNDGSTNQNQKPRTKNHTTATPAARFDPLSISLGTQQLDEAWARWVKYRRKRARGMTEDGWRGQAENLLLWQSNGHEIVQIIKESIDGGWQGLFEPKTGRSGLPPLGKQAALEKQNREKASVWVPPEQRGENAGE